jgi:hypothetical protein
MGIEDFLVLSAKALTFLEVYFSTFSALEPSNLNVLSQQACWAVCFASSKRCGFSAVSVVLCCACSERSAH